MAWALSCALTSFALMALFTRFARKSPLGESLSRNAYGMYLTHYGLVTWLQYGLIRWAASPILKALIVIALATAGSWLLAMALRRIPLVARVSERACVLARQEGEGLFFKGSDSPRTDVKPAID